MKDLVVYIDGASRGNPGRAGAGVWITNGEGGKRAEISRYLGHKTNNEAEYEALVAALEFAVYQRNENITIYTDSKLVFGQVMKGWKCQDKFRGYLTVIRVLLPVAKLEWVPREDNLAGELFE